MSDTAQDIRQPTRYKQRFYGNDPRRVEEEVCDRVSVCCDRPGLGETELCSDCKEHNGFKCEIHEIPWDDAAYEECPHDC